jgi:hypothetical protein
MKNICASVNILDPKKNRVGRYGKVFIFIFTYAMQDKNLILTVLVKKGNKNFRVASKN